ncbi:MAG: hypothetical protein HIU93_05035 [Acidobacteria bacterium]|nr:hypothetical protein [Acidobacteriota bacterium]MBW4044922.1 hypothetical protein [Acidobacteriota bacterium]
MPKRLPILFAALCLPFLHATAVRASAMAPPSGIALAACRDISRSGTYYLTKDVTCTTPEGFALNADKITLNLNGHTIRYGSAKSSGAITLCDQWFRGGPGCTGGGRHAAAVIYGGKIIQAANAAPFSSAIWIGQASGIRGGAIHDLEITIASAGSTAIQGTYAGGGWSIYGNTINDRVTNIQHPDQKALSARSQLQGYAIRLADNPLTGKAVPNQIYNNKINGSPQGGIVDSNPNSVIHDNVIHLTSSYSNDYGVIIMAAGQNVYNNHVDGRGRGFDIENSNDTLKNNTVTVHEEANNSEYRGCELDGADGIRVKQYVTNADNPQPSSGKPITGLIISGNIVTVDSTHCQARALSFTNMTRGVTGAITGNTFTATGPAVQVAAGSNYNAALAFGGYQNPHIVFTKNNFASTNVLVEIRDDGDMWPSVDGVIQGGQMWTPAPVTVFDGELSRGKNTPPERLTIMDTLPASRIKCGDYSAATITVGSHVKTCGR